MKIEPYLKLYRPPLKGVCLEYFFPHLGEEGERFAREMYATCPRKFVPFHQGGAHDMQGGWHLFEFWNFNVESKLVIDFCKEIAKKFDKELIIDLSGVPSVESFNS